MLRSIKRLFGDRLSASDGQIGQVKDVYFDDQSWAVRYVVVDTGSWLPGRQVLIAPYAFGNLHRSGKTLRVSLTRAQIERSPSIETHKPVSRPYEEGYHRSYGWPDCWPGDAWWGMSGFPSLGLRANPLVIERATVSEAYPEPAEAHLRSAQAVRGYHLRASDGTIGHVCDCMMDSRSWAIAQVVVKTGPRLSGQEVRIPASAVARISYEDSTVFVTWKGQAVEHCPAHHLAADSPRAEPR